MPPIYDKRTSTRSARSYITPTRSSKARQGHEAEKNYWRQGQTIQHDDLQASLYPGLRADDQEIWDNGFIQYTDGKSAIVSLIASLSKSHQSELAHRLSRMWYRTSNKNQNFINQITVKERRTGFYKAMLDEINKDQNPPLPVPAPQPVLEDGDTPGNLTEHYWIPKAATVRNLTSWLAENEEDPALRVSVQPSSVDG